MAIIKAYGEFWSRDAVDWGKKGPGGQGKLLGHCGPKAAEHVVDAWKQEAVYLLHAEHAVVYIGVASGTELGPRLRHHLSDSLAGRWDQFSWYGAASFNTPPGKPAPGAKPLIPAMAPGGNASASVHDLLRELEALMIRAAPTTLNKKTEGLDKAAALVRQQRCEPPTLDELRDSLDAIKKKLGI